MKKEKRKSKDRAKEKPKTEIIFTTGKRKRAVARARFKKGPGIVKINSKPLELIESEMVRLKIQEPLILAGDSRKDYSIRVDVKGGGVMGQAEATRQAIAKGLVQILGQDLRKKFLKYDRNLLIHDPRRTEVHKPPHSSLGARKHKQRSKR